MRVSIEEALRKTLERVADLEREMLKTARSITKILDTLIDHERRLKTLEDKEDS